MTIADIRLALRLTVEDYDAELLRLAAAGMADLTMAGITGATALDGLDAVTGMAVLTYIRMHFGQPEDYDRLARSYEAQKMQLKLATGHTDWGDAG